MAARPRRAIRRPSEWVRPWLFAAALYNAIWGSVMVVAPELLLSRLLNPMPAELLAWRVVGMMVLAFAPAYWWAARNPVRARPIVAVGALGKLMGLTGFLVLALAGDLPWRFGLTILTNDLIWLPAFVAFLVTDDPPGEGAARRTSYPTPSPDSPYAELLRDHMSSLPAAHRAQFLGEPIAGVVSIARGTLHRVWWRPRILTPVFSVLGRMGILVPRQGADVPMSLTLRLGTDDRGNPYHVCHRDIDLPGSRFITRKTFDRDLGLLIESMGPHGIFQVAWETRVRLVRGVVFRQIGLGLRLGGRTVWLAPSAWLPMSGRASFIQLVSRDDAELVRIRFTLRHPIFGRCFGYEGSFRLADPGARPSGGNASP